MAVVWTLTLTWEDGGLPLTTALASAQVDEVVKMVREYGEDKIAAGKLNASTGIIVDYNATDSATIKLT